jgi:uncharacterized phage-associated protein
MPAPYDSRSIANEILRIARKDNKPLTIMQLIKLVYFAHGYSLGILDVALSKHEAQAWQHGPVMPPVYKSFKGSGSQPIVSFAENKLTGFPYREEFTAQEREILQGVVDTYGGMHAFELSNMLHQPDEPWTIVFNRDGAYSTIPNELIKQDFKKLIAPVNG